MELNTVIGDYMECEKYNIEKLKYDIFLNVWQKIYDIYPLFKEKNINWLKIKKIYSEKVKDVNSFEELYNLLNDMILNLKDPHTKIFNYNFKNQYDIAPILMTYLNNKIYIIHILDDNIKIQKGSEITHINNINIDDFKKKIYSKYNFNSLNVKNMYVIREITNYFAHNKAEIQVTFSGKSYLYKIHPLNVEYIIKNNSAYNVKSCDSKIIDKDILYIKLLSFYDKKIIPEFKELLLKHENLNKIIIDVRDNNGGLIDVATKLTSFLIDTNKVVLYKKYRTCESNYKKFSKDIPICIYSNKLINYKKLAILCNENTSSSSECIFIRSLINSHSKIRVFGNKTAGLIHEATIYTLFDGVKLQITSNKYLDEDRQLMIEEGIEPNCKIINNIENVLEGNDLVLNASIKFCNF